MTDRTASHPSVLHNWISLAGIVLAASSFFAVTCLIAIDYFRGFANPYIGILTYLVAPAFLFTGLALVCIGAVRERRRRRRRHPGEVAVLPRIDLNDKRQRGAVVAVTVATFAFLLMTALGSYRTYEFTESVVFCGKTCHSIMQPEYTAYRESPHARVKCVQCHIGPGASWFVKSKLSGAYQVYASLFDKYPRPIPVPIENLRPARDTCEQCHWPEKFFGEAERDFYHYLPDEKNSLWTIRMLVKIGGGNPTAGAVGGIHWHMAIANKIEYIASDHGRQVIPWVRLTDRQGVVTVYQSTDDPLKPEQIAAATPRVMDCIDCHNRPTHIYHSPVDAVDLALRAGRIDSSIPRIKERAVRVLAKKYGAASEATRDIADTLESYYRSKYPAFYEANAKRIAQAVAETQRIYAENFFPAMKVRWDDYPDDIGHWDFPGCDRCHDGDHRNADGKVIPPACDTCHTIIAQGPAGNMESDLAGLEFKHPVDIDAAWKQMTCSDCHAGDLVE